MQVWSASEVTALTAAPPPAALPDDVTLVVDLRTTDPADLRPLGGLPRVVVGIGRDHPAADVLVPDEAAAEQVALAAAAHPIAATALVLHLRATERSPVDAALIAESATYSMLQAGPEHRLWLTNRASRPPRPDDDERVRVSRDGAHVHIALARPAARNAVDAAMQQALVDALATVDEADDVVLTGDGPVFSAGGDLDEFGSLEDPASAHLLRLARSPARALARLAAQTTVVVQGACHGAGVELPAFAHRVVARPGTTFTLPEVRLGLIPGAGGTVSIPRRIGRQRTAWLALTSETIDAETARTWGLVDEVSTD